jgi:hypothetical protein
MMDMELRLLRRPTPGVLSKSTIRPHECGSATIRFAESCRRHLATDQPPYR